MLVLACGASQSQVTKTVDDATACAFGVVAAATGAVDVQALLACGLTVADALALLQELRAQAVPADAGAAALEPARVAYVAKLDQAIATLRTMKEKGAK